MPSTLALVRTLFRDERGSGRSRSILSGVMSGGVGLGPVLAGVLLERYWWGSVFVVNLPVVALLLVLGPRLLPGIPGAPVERRSGRVGAAAGGDPAPNRRAEVGHHARLVADRTPALARGRPAPLLVRRESRVAAPMVDPSLLRRPAFPATLLLQVIAMGFG